MKAPSATPLQRKVMFGVLALVFVLLALATPDRSKPAVPEVGTRAFAWDANPLWRRLHAQFEEARHQPLARVNPRIEVLFATVRTELSLLVAANAGPSDTRFDALQNDLFTLSAFVAAHPSRAAELAAFVTTMRTEVKKLSETWRADENARRRLYRLLYGSRGALEEVLLQAGRGSVPEVLMGVDEPSAAPSVVIRGVRIHSGDVLLSRGETATSALIARGNDYPGNFSHVALVHIDERTHRVSLIEAHIEVGVVVSSLESYLGDGKLRILVLRPRADLPALVANPSLAHVVATRALRRAQERHIPYDFEMDYADHDKAFCSEVASAPYADAGVSLWQSLSSMSSHANSFWLASFGVTHFQTHAPADLEYDPQLRVVAEWRNPATLLQDHVDNAIVDTLLEEADRGEPIRFKWWMLPFARLAKGYSVVLNWFGKVGPVPEGMNAAVALRASSLASRHARIRARVMNDIRRYREGRHAMPPYWDLVTIARTQTSRTPW
ncbi:MAG: hypothetical protein IPK60_21595 [Sandaracinaceae bacterium]|nr:hypothetical protein [Sandaracinaceae bacterium]